MKNSTSILFNNTRIAEEENDIVGALDFRFNRKFHFLPIDVKEVFPNLVVLYAASCSIKSIGKENFQGLKELQYVNLFGNHIEKVPSDTFQGLDSLKRIYLGENFFVY